MIGAWKKNYKVEYVRGMGSAGWVRGVTISNSFPRQPQNIPEDVLFQEP